MTPFGGVLRNTLKWPHLEGYYKLCVNDSVWGLFIKSPEMTPFDGKLLYPPKQYRLQGYYFFRRSGKKWVRSKIFFSKSDGIRHAHAYSELPAKFRKTFFFDQKKVLSFSVFRCGNPFSRLVGSFYGILKLPAQMVSFGGLCFHPCKWPRYTGFVVSLQLGSFAGFFIYPCKWPCLGGYYYTPLNDPICRDKISTPQMTLFYGFSSSGDEIRNRWKWWKNFFRKRSGIRDAEVTPDLPVKFGGTFFLTKKNFFPKKKIFAGEFHFVFCC